MKKISLILISIWSVCSLAADLKKAKSADEIYTKAGKEVMAMINSGKIDQAKAETEIKKMVEQAKIIAKEYASTNAESKKLVDLTIELIPEMLKAETTFKILQEKYHDGGAYTKDKVGVDIKAEKYEKFLDPVHTIVHPIMTLRAIKDNNLKDAKEELAEGLEQSKASLKSIK